LIVYPVALLIIAAIVYCGLCKKRNMWAWIVLYWATLCVKNLVDAVMATGV